MDRRKADVPEHAVPPARKGVVRGDHQPEQRSELDPGPTNHQVISLAKPTPVWNRPIARVRPTQAPDEIFVSPVSATIQ